jgi:hypothetical protein
LFRDPAARLKLRLQASLCLLFTLIVAPLARTAPVSAAGRALLAAGHTLVVAVEFEPSAADATADIEKRRRAVPHDDAAILALRTAGYAAVKASVEGQLKGEGAIRILDYSHFPLAIWRLSSLGALSRLPR